MARGVRLFVAGLAAYFVAVEVAKAAVCRPVSALWARRGPGARARCVDLHAILVIDTLLAILADVAILVVPVVSTRFLRVSLPQKLRVIGLLGAGASAVGATIYRERLIVAYGHTTNYTQDLARIMFSW